MQLAGAREECLPARTAAELPAPGDLALLPACGPWPFLLSAAAALLPLVGPPSPFKPSPAPAAEELLTRGSPAPSLSGRSGSVMLWALAERASSATHTRSLAGRCNRLLGECTRQRVCTCACFYAQVALSRRLKAQAPAVHAQTVLFVTVMPMMMTRSCRTTACCHVKAMMSRGKGLHS